MLGIETSLLKDFSLFGWARGETAHSRDDARIEPQLGLPAELAAKSDETTRAAAAVDIRLSKEAQAAGGQNDLLMLPAPDERPKVRNMTPRELADFAYNMYMDGTLNWEEYRMVGFPSELHPDYDKTIGQLTGENAQPDRPKDMVMAWQQRVDFEERYSADKPEVVERARRVLDILRWQDMPPEPVKLEV